LIIRSQTKVTSEILEAASNLKAVGRAGVGVDNVDRDAATNHGVIVMNTPTGNTISTAELAFTLMLSAARNIGPAHSAVRNGDFAAARKAYKGIELNEKRLAVIGMGRIGAEFAKRAQAFGMTVVAYDPFLTQSRADQLKVELATSPDAALTGADVVTLHVPLTDDTRHIINAERLNQMKDNAILVNSSRGPIIDETALVAHCQSHPDFRVGLDVFENEPAMAPGLADLDNVVIVPHIASATVWTREGMASLAACNVAATLQGLPVWTGDDVLPFLKGTPPKASPSIVNASELGHS